MFSLPPQDVHTFSQDLLDFVELAQSISSFALKGKIGLRELPSELLDNLSLLLSAALGTHRTLIMWNYRDLLVHAKNNHTTQIKSSVRDVSYLRGQLLRACATCLQVSADEVLFSADHELNRRVGVTAYRIVNELRALFPQRLKEDYDDAESLSISIDGNTTRALKRIFDEESERVRNLLEELDKASSVDQELLSTNLSSRKKSTNDSILKDLRSREATRETQREKLSLGLVREILLPLAGSLVFDTEHLNRRQAAAALSFLFNERTTINEAAKSIAKTLRERDPLKFMHVQMMLLKDVMADCQRDSNDKVTRDRFIAAGRKLSLLLGVRVIGDTASAVQEFLVAGTDFASQSLDQSLFFAALTQYVRLVAISSRNELTDRVQQIVNSREFHLRKQILASEDFREFSKALSPNFSTTKKAKVKGMSATWLEASKVRESASIISQPSRNNKQQNLNTSSRRSGRVLGNVSYADADSDIDDAEIESVNDLSEIESDGRSNSRTERKSSIAKKSETQQVKRHWATGLDIVDSSDAENDDVLALDDGLRIALAMPPKRALKLESQQSLPSRKRRLNAADS
jgi:hypothetical protein